LGSAGLCYGQTPDYLNRQLRALDAIKSTAESICYTIQQGGRTISSVAKAQLADTASSVRNLNLSADMVEYSGLEQQALASALNGSQSCRMNVFDTLVVLMVPGIQATGLPVKASIRLTPRLPSHAPSIDCTRTNEPLEDLLCADDDLAVLDGRMGQLYRQRRAVLDHVPSENLKRDQIAWLGIRDRTCNYNKQEKSSIDALAPAKPCLLQMIHARIAALNKW